MRMLPPRIGSATMKAKLGFPRFLGQACALTTPSGPSGAAFAPSYGRSVKYSWANSVVTVDPTPPAAAVR
jgi:hypothetical protein